MLICIIVCSVAIVHKVINWFDLYLACHSRLEFCLAFDVDKQKNSFTLNLMFVFSSVPSNGQSIIYDTFWRSKSDANI